MENATGVTITAASICDSCKNRPCENEFHVRECYMFQGKEVSKEKVIIFSKHVLINKAQAAEQLGAVAISVCSGRNRLKDSNFLRYPSATSEFCNFPCSP